MGVSRLASRKKEKKRSEAKSKISGACFSLCSYEVFFMSCKVDEGDD